MIREDRAKDRNIPQHLYGLHGSDSRMGRWSSTHYKFMRKSSMRRTENGNLPEKFHIVETTEERS
jgi:hypothetical protein